MTINSARNSRLLWTMDGPVHRDRTCDCYNGHDITQPLPGGKHFLWAMNFDTHQMALREAIFCPSCGGRLASE